MCLSTFNIIVFELLFVITPFIIFRDEWISFYTNDEIVSIITYNMAPIVAFVIFSSSVEVTLGGAIRAIGKQK